MVTRISPICCTQPPSLIFGGRTHVHVREEAVIITLPSANDIKTRMLYNYEQDEQRQMFLQQTYVPQVYNFS